jgi:hypothetical protein
MRSLSPTTRPAWSLSCCSKDVSCSLSFKDYVCRFIFRLSGDITLSSGLNYSDRPIPWLVIDRRKLTSMTTAIRALPFPFTSVVTTKNRAKSVIVVNALLCVSCVPRLMILCQPGQFFPFSLLRELRSILFGHRFQKHQTSRRKIMP